MLTKEDGPRPLQCIWSARSGDYDDDDDDGGAGAAGGGACDTAGGGACGVSSDPYVCCASVVV